MTVTTTTITCIMPTTARRRWTIPLSIACFQRQTYPHRQLIVVSDGEGDVSDLIPTDERIRHVHVKTPPTLGDKYNECIKLADGWIALWADDDWHSPTRLERAADHIGPEVEMIGSRSVFIHELSSQRRSFVYEFPRERPERYFVGGTLLFHKRLWQRCPFPSSPRGSDGAFTLVALDPERGNARAGELASPEPYVVMVHGANTGTQVPCGDPWWNPISTDIVQQMMSGDLPKYETAYQTAPHNWSTEHIEARLIAEGWQMISDDGVRTRWHHGGNVLDLDRSEPLMKLLRRLAALGETSGPW